MRAEMKPNLLGVRVSPEAIPRLLYVTMHGRTLSITEKVIAVVSPDSEGVRDDLRALVEDRGIDFAAVAVGEDIDEHYDPDVETLGVPIGGDGTFLEGVQQFAPRAIPVLGINTGTLAFLTRVTPADMEDALMEALRGRAKVAHRQQFHAETRGLEGVGINDLIVQAVPPDDPTGRKIVGLHVYVDGEYAGRYDGTGVAVSTPTGSTGISLSANGPIHFPENNFTLQIVPLHTHQMGARPLVLGPDADVSIVPEGPADLLVDGGRKHTRLAEDDVVRVTGSSVPAYLVRTSYDDEFFASISEKLGWGPRSEEAAGPSHLIETSERSEPFLGRARRIAIEAAESAGEPLRELHSQIEDVEYKTDKSDIVTDADYRANHIITTVIRNEFPDHNIRSEESDRQDRGSQYTWVIDPLDGTGNFAHGNPNYSISIALLDGETPIVGVVYAPEPDEMFSAIAGETAYENDHVLSTTDREHLDESMFLSGYDPDGSFLTRFYQEARGVRRLGSAALHLCYLASGSTDAIWEYDTYPWDVAAGLVIARTAGAKITDAAGNEFKLRLDANEERKELLGTNGPLHDDVLDHLSAVSGDLGPADAD